jgi:hypothetical protein
VVGEVVDGPAAGPAAGAIVSCFAGWEDCSVVPVSPIGLVRAEGPLHHHLGVFGHNGLAAYFGMLKVGRGQLETITKVWDGLDAAPLVAMLAAENIRGQVVVRIGPDPS